MNDFIPDASPEQIRAWDQSIPWLQRECRQLTAHYSPASEYTAILEYELPRDFRRPDVIILEHGCVAVLELKGYTFASQAAIDQALGYARDLAAYHAACAGRTVTPVLLIRDGATKPVVQDGVYIVAPEGLNRLLQGFTKADEPAVSVEEFLALDAYAPLPSIVQAARELFNKRPLPMIKRARAATDPALKYMTAVAHEAAHTQTRHLVLLSGIPGSGKTLVGLQLVHAGWIDDLAVDRGSGKPSAPAVYLSGNGPLVEVLQDALREGGGGGRTFVQGIKPYVTTYSRPRAPAPPEHLIVFDEAQRAHDAERVAKVQKRPVEKSEPQHLLHFCNRIPEWCVLVALIGEGQAIHQGEEGGIPLWADAVRQLDDDSRWVVHGASRFAEYFSNSNVQQHWREELNLEVELRFHLTPRVHEFVDGLLGCQHRDHLALIAAELNQDAHRFLVTRNLDAACGYLRERYIDAQEARYGLIASSKDKWLPQFGVDNSFGTTRRLRVGRWYNAAPSDSQSCCQLDRVATEFSSQGLELDCALVAWGSDLLWKVEGWSIADSRNTRGKVQDAMTMRKNVYRVLLTRGRDGTVIFVPPDSRFDMTFARLRDCGVRQLA